jgi:hypothetical protein
MVVITRELLEQQAGRRLVRSLGVHERDLHAAERINGGVDWAAMMYSLDRVFLRCGGPMGQVKFLRESHDELGGQTAYEALLEPGGPARVCRAASQFSSQ